MKRVELDHLKAGTWHLDCISIELCNHDGSRIHSGPGYIRQQGSGGFQVTVFVPGTFDLSDAMGPLVAPGIALGMLLPETHYWSMIATDTSNRTWRAKRIANPALGGTVNACGHVVAGNVYELISANGEEEASTRVRCQMRLFSKLRFPRNQHRKTTVVRGPTTEQESYSWDVAAFTAEGFTFELVDEGNDETVLYASSESGTLHPFFETRVTEALLFALGTKISWSIVEHLHRGITTTKIRPFEEPVPRGAVQPPIAFHEVAPSDEVWRLFELYLAYVCGDEESLFHRLSGAVLALVKSTEGSVEAEALTAAVEVESVLDRFFKSFGIVDDATVQQIDELLAHLRLWSGDQTLKGRAFGSLGSLKSVRPYDRLRELIKRNVVSRSNVNAWRTLRNAVAHGDWSGVENLQSFIDRTCQVEVLFYQLVFHLIGYTGRHTDWASKDWPFIDYPPQQQTQPNCC